MMNTENLVRMANNIGDFFAAEPDRQVAVAGIANHIRQFWEFRMRKAIIEHHQAGGEGLNELPAAAVAMLASEAR